MTDSAQASFNDNLERAAEHQQLQMWRAAQIVKSHVSPKQDRADVLDCLGLTDVERPAGL